jgi:hypothetical protein
LLSLGSVQVWVDSGGAGRSGAVARVGEKQREDSGGKQCEAGQGTCMTKGSIHINQHLNHDGLNLGDENWS